MKKIMRVGILTITLVVPALIVIFLNLFGENKYNLEEIDPVNESQDLQIYNPKVVNCQSDSLPHKVPYFSFTSQENKEVNHTTVDGKIYVANFFFSRCPSTCPSMMSSLLRVQDFFSDNPEIKILSHTVDPEYDSTYVLKTYAEKFGAKQDFWHFLTGAKEDLYEIARCGYFIVAKPSEDQKNEIRSRRPKASSFCRRQNAKSQ